MNQSTYFSNNTKTCPWSLSLITGTMLSLGTYFEYRLATRVLFFLCPSELATCSSLPAFTWPPEGFSFLFGNPPKLATGSSLWFPGHWPALSLSILPIGLNHNLIFSYSITKLKHQKTTQLQLMFNQNFTFCHPFILPSSRTLSKIQTSMLVTWNRKDISQVSWSSLWLV